MPLLPGESPEAYRSRLEREIKEYESEEGTLVLTDVTGGTPFNSTGYLAKDHKIGIVSGMNMPMLITLIFARTEKSTLDDLIQEAVSPGALAVKGMNLSKGGRKHGKLSLNKN